LPPTEPRDQLAPLPDGGLLGNPDQLAQVFRSVSDDGPSRGLRTVEVHPAGGITLRLLVDRGLDIGSAWVAGGPVAFRSAVGETAAGAAGGWLGGWGGGLLTTCGLRNVGAPSEGHPMHGTATTLAARDVTVTRTALPDGHVAVAVHGTLLDPSAFGPSLLLERTVTVRSGRPEVEVTDRTTNLGPGPEQTPILYHVNFGSPFLDPASTVTGQLDWTRPRDPRSAAVAAGWAVMGPVTAEERDDVFEHGVPPDHDGWAALDVSSPATGLSAQVRWDARTLPRVHTWRRATRGTYALAVEPANCSVLGREADRAAGTAPRLEPGEQRTTRVQVRLLNSAGGR
jgi:hypothetical protein